MIRRFGSRRRGALGTVQRYALATLAPVAIVAAVLVRPEHGLGATLAWTPAAFFSWGAVLSLCSGGLHGGATGRKGRAASTPLPLAKLDRQILEAGPSFLGHKVVATGPTMAELVHPADLGIATDLELEALAQPGRTAASAMRIFDGDGFKWFEVRLMSRRGATGSPNLAVALRGTGETGTYVPGEGGPYLYDARSRSHVSLAELGRLRDKVRAPEAWAGGPGRPLALVLMEVGAYAEVSANRGAACAEELIARTAARMTLRLGDGDLLTRMSTNTLGVLVGAAESEHEVENLVNHLYHLFSAPVVIDGRTCATQVSIGASSGSEAGGLPMLARAELALRSASQQLHGRVVWFDPEVHVRPRDQVNATGRTIVPTLTS